MSKIVSSIGLVVLATNAWAQDFSDLAVPTDRYIRENAELLTLSYWPEGIAFEAVGSVPADLGLQSASLAQVLSGQAETKFAMVGRPNSWFSPKERIGHEANLVVHFAEFKDPEARTAEIIYVGRDVDIDLQDARPEIRSLFASGLPFQGPGCYAAWSANEENKINSFVVVIDASNSKEQQEACIDFMIPSSLGVLPVFSTYDYSEEGPKSLRASEPFIDKSELNFLLRASAYCRNAVEDFSLSCPADLLGAVYKRHEELLNDAN
ncbi:hypothetical protein FGK63_20235 [Ruegeria sediminis]|uniref:DUF2927 domain-containing protein n=1 Tax=Ruegeria sediminis TaxID=2583820 RepID=A0ABY2WSV2_9RHOB|nr:hypothetical protein [Ruegeria sediminis]TMV02561.1 hypothetical protein FGK63_20235 [Ruegeria sediminis]